MQRMILGVYYATWLSLGVLIGTAGAGKNGGPACDGAEVQIDLPVSEHCHNVTSAGQGCCVQTSINHSARWQSVPALVDFQKWVQEKGLPGGANPRRVDERIPACCKDRGYPPAPYLQIEGMDLALLKLACRGGRMPGVTFSNAGDPLGHYDGGRIAHMVSLAGADVGSGHWWIILDNNYPGEYGWLSEAEFARAYAPGWAVVLLANGPPPVPHNKRAGALANGRVVR